ncbi:alpha/beta fold hydrolase [Neorhizobium lilium]|uniref:Alpha/beta fold hydrolase n=1 Tax=Neorhizobium lilium TaxID=2503024 RepID=A0A444LLA9_9HYPH|nr:alpha/beta fold hydrolase [Neorhizobium lilium]RWX81115.1 alpha/beta fold hydrolase [Neorhizobium lilium]
MDEIAFERDKDGFALPSGQRQAAFPVVFHSTVGLFMSSDDAERSNTAILFLSPWGLEEISTRKFRRLIADALADRGIPSLRFDYPGTGDALDPPSFENGLDVWEQSVVAGAEFLKSLGYNRLILIGQGLGGTLAVKTASRLANVDGIALLAPASKGRALLREISVWAKVVDSYTNLKVEEAPSGRITIAGLSMPDEIAADIRTLDLVSLPHPPNRKWLVFNRPDPGVASLISHLRSRGDEIEEHPFPGYQELIANPLTSKIPCEVVSAICDWAHRVKDHAPQADGRRSPGFIASGILSGDGFVETPVRFGLSNRLYGIVCRPVGPRTGATAVLLGSAYDRHSGWGRVTTETARALARSGIASLRFDCANVADSPPLMGAPSQVLYDESQYADVSDALDCIESEGLAPAIVVGRCSGAYLGFRSILKDKERICGVVAANPFTFYWDKENPRDLVSTTQSLQTYGRKALDLGTIKRLMRRDVDVRRVARNITAGAIHRITGVLGTRLAFYWLQTTEQKYTIRYFRYALNNSIPVDLVYSADDIGLDNLKRYFRIKGSTLDGFTNVAVDIIDGADHNLTPKHARQVFQDHILKMALKFRPTLRL